VHLVNNKVAWAYSYMYPRRFRDFRQSENKDEVPGRKSTNIAQSGDKRPYRARYYSDWAHIEEENRGWMDVLFLGGGGNGPCKETLKRVSKFLPLDQDNHYSVGHISE
jgi:hypothetical protein